ncbi:Uncharacterised protein [Propionibacterium australiense]|uniref:Uncharacterized protein n=1 Tax=Propionibacterium australiense TaxID=119981 RepID=A0A383S7H9_9ACTN|nr:Hypothetical protein PROPAUS_1431 [Propionibacterium australiense]VEH89653.1 Uncharacterised protein [Propionibacterium australiense]
MDSRGVSKYSILTGCKNASRREAPNAIQGSFGESRITSDQQHLRLADLHDFKVRNQAFKLSTQHI